MPRKAPAGEFCPGCGGVSTGVHLDRALLPKRDFLEVLDEAREELRAKGIVVDVGAMLKELAGDEEPPP